MTSSEKLLYLLIHVEESEFLRAEYVPGRFKQKDSSNPALDLNYAAVNVWTSNPTAAVVVNEKKQGPSEHFWLDLPDWGWNEGFIEVPTSTIRRRDSLAQASAQLSLAQASSWPVAMWKEYNRAWANNRRAVVSQFFWLHTRTSKKFLSTHPQYRYIYVFINYTHVPWLYALRFW